VREGDLDVQEAGDPVRDQHEAHHLRRRVHLRDEGAEPPEEGGEGRQLAPAVLDLLAEVQQVREGLQRARR
jgi:hypothetical protein